jgi:integrase
MAKRITEAVAVALQAHAGSKDVFVFDTLLSGYALRRTPNGTLVHLARARAAGRKVTVSLGRWPEMKTAEARELARLTIADVRAGRDPALERRARLHAAAANGVTLEAFAANWMSEHVRLKLKPKTATDYEQQLRKHVIPAIGGRTIAGLTFSDVNALHVKMKATPRAANYVVGMLSAMMAHAIRTGLRRDNPARGVTRYAERLRERFLSPIEFTTAVGAINAAVDGGIILPQAGAALKLALYTGARRGEICSTNWSNIDWERRIIRLQESKTGARTIHLNDRALDVLRSLPRTGALIIGLKPRTLDRAWGLVRTRCGLTDVRLHDLRHSFASLALKSGIPLAMVGKLLGHKRASTTERYGHLAAIDVAAASDIVGEAFTGMTAAAPPSTVVAGGGDESAYAAAFDAL